MLEESLNLNRCTGTVKKILTVIHLLLRLEGCDLLLGTEKGNEAIRACWPLGLTCISLLAYIIH